METLRIFCQIMTGFSAILLAPLVYMGVVIATATSMWIAIPLAVPYCFLSGSLAQRSSEPSFPYWMGWNGKKPVQK